MAGSARPSTSEPAFTAGIPADLRQNAPGAGHERALNACRARIFQGKFRIYPEPWPGAFGAACTLHGTGRGPARRNVEPAFRLRRGRVSAQAVQLPTGARAYAYRFTVNGGQDLSDRARSASRRIGSFPARPTITHGTRWRYAPRSATALCRGQPWVAVRRASRLRSQARAWGTMGSRAWNSGVQGSVVLMRDTSAISAAGSPSRRDPTTTGKSTPLTRLTEAITSITDAPRP